MQNLIQRTWVSTEIRLSQSSLPWIAFICSLTLLTVGVIFYGYRISVDTHWFVENGIYLWNWLLAPETEPLDQGRLLKMKAYIIPSLFLGGAHLLPSGLANSFIIGMQIFMYSTVVFVCFRIWQLVEHPPQYKLPWLIGGLFITFGLVDVPIWTYWLLTDITFFFWSALFMYALVLAIIGESGKHWWTSLILAIVALIVRPTGVCLPFIWFATLLFWIIYRKTGRNWLPFLIVVLVPATLVIFIVPWLYLLDQGGYQFPDWFEKSIIGQNFAEASTLFNKGIIMANREGATFENPSSYLDYVSIVLLRLYYHYVPFRHGHSILHHITNIIYFPTALILAAYGLKELIQRNQRCLYMAAVIMIFAVYFGLLHSVTLLAFSWRYQVPATLCMWLVAGFGLKFLLQNSFISQGPPP